MLRRLARFQILGWTLLGAVDLLTNPDAPGGWAIYTSAALAGTGLLVSTALFAIAGRRLAAGGRRAILAAAAGALVGSATWYLANAGLDVAVGFPDRPSLIGGLFGRGMLQLVVMVAWHAAVVAAGASQRAADNERLAAEARLLALRYQLQPHFLFNALNSAIALIDSEPERAQTMLILLADLLRHTLEGDASREVPLAGELETIDRYLEIQKVRFEDRLRITRDIDGDALERPVPPLVVHSLVENAVKHGMRGATGPLELDIAAAIDDGALRIEVTNDGRYEPGDGGVGLAAVRERLAAQYPDRHRFSVDQRGERVVATLELFP